IIPPKSRIIPPKSRIIPPFKPYVVRISLIPKYVQVCTSSYKYSFAEAILALVDNFLTYFF
ncbi:MAG: hypothetical protein IIY81_11970, partial [Lachnospiraceae bacterium]|nr:hypothetical protein [Lachnospiraceae bacterium]